MGGVDMKIAELMIGDWVKIKGHIDCNKVREIARDENMQWYISFASSATLFRAYKFEPIPLTPEILEKNGFWVMENVDNGAEEYIVYATAGLILHYNRDNDYYFPNTPISWKYVHELQHALHFCGLHELADNFKV